MKKRLALLAVPLLAITALSACGDGALKRHVTLSGLYSVCKPDGYPVVCFLDSDSKQGGLFCMPLSEVGGDCK